MAKYAGLVGYVTQVEKKPGLWESDSKSVLMKGDVLRQSYSSQNGDKVNSDISLSHRISLIGDSYTFDNLHFIKWIMFNGMKWEVTSVEIQRPRIIVSLGGLWNG